MKEVGFLSMMGVGPKSAAPAPVPASSHHDRFFSLHDELQARFPGTEIKVQSWRNGNYWSLECEIKGRRPDGTHVTFKVESKQTQSDPNPQSMEKFFKEIDSWA